MTDTLTRDDTATTPPNARIVWAKPAPPIYDGEPSPRDQEHRCGCSECQP